MKKLLIVLIVTLSLSLCILTGCSLFDDLTGGGLPYLNSYDIYTQGQDNKDYEYTGKPIELDITKIFVRITDVEEDIPYTEFDFEYANNVNIGTATLTLTAKSTNKYCKGSASVRYYIVAPTSIVQTVEELEYRLADANFNNITIAGKLTIPEGKQLEIKKGVTVTMTSDTVLTNCGKIVNNGNIVVGRKRGIFQDSAKLVNKGEIQNKNSIEVLKGSGFYNAGTITNTDARFMNNGDVVVNDEEFDGVYYEEFGKVYVRTRATDDNIASVNPASKKMTYEQGTTSYTLLVNVKGNGGYSSFSSYYTDNDKAGIAHMHLTMDDTDKYLYGELDIEFEIEKGFAYAYNDEELHEILSCGNYNQCIVAYDFTVPAGSVFTVAHDMRFGIPRGHSCQIDGTFVNNGEANFYSHPTVTGKLVNHGEMLLTTDKAQTLICNLENDGNLSIQGNTTFSDSSHIVNLQGGVLKIQYGVMEFDGIAIENSGQIVNNTTIFCESYTNFVAGNFDNSNGQIWTKVEIDGIVQNITLQVNLADADVKLEYYEVVYDGSVWLPEVSVTGDELIMSEFTLRYRYEGTTQNTTQPINAGTINVTLTSKTRESKYYGERVLSYTILRATKEVDTLSSMVRYLSNDNYDKVVLTANVNADYTITSNIVIVDTTLDLNGYRLSLPQAYHSIVLGTDGVLLNTRELTGDDDNFCGIVIDGNGSIEIKGGRLENNNRIIVTSSQGITITRGELINNGVIYHNADIPQAQGSGRVVVRKKLSSDLLQLEYTETDYDTSAKTPAITLLDDVDVSFDEIFDVVYSSNVNAGVARVNVTLKHGLLDEHYYGSYSFNFTINKCVHIVQPKGANESETDYIAKLNRDLADLNYIKHILSGHLHVTECELIVPDYAELDVSTYILRVYTGGKLTVSEHGMVNVAVDSVLRLREYMLIANRMYLSSDIGSVTETVTFNNLTAPDRTLYNLAKSPLAVLLDLNGYAFLPQIELINASYYTLNLTIVDSSADKTGILGDFNSDVYAIKLSSVYATSAESCKYILNLDGVKVAGIYSKIGNGGTYQLNVSNCTLMKSTVDEYSELCAVFADTCTNGSPQFKFTDCWIEGPTGARLNSVSSGTTFTNCTIRGLARSDGNGRGAAVFIKVHRSLVAFSGGYVYSEHYYAMWISGSRSDGYPSNWTCDGKGYLGWTHYEHED